MSRIPAHQDVSAPAWIKSSYSDSSNPNDCVAAAITPASIHVRDSKTPEGPRLTVTPAAWADFVAVAAER